MRRKTKGIVIREVPKGETSKLLTVLTTDLGVITVNAKGVRKISSPFLKSTQTFAFSDMLLHEKNGYYTLTEAYHIADFYDLSQDIKKYALACYLCEAASAFAISGEDSTDILRLLLNSLYAMEKDIATLNIIKSAFELRLCAESGFYPDIENCVECNREMNNEHFIFHIQEGVAFCRDCAVANKDYRLIPYSVGKAIIHITQSDISKFISFRIGEAEENLLSDIAEKYFLLRAERGFKTLSFYKHCEDLQ